MSKLLTQGQVAEMLGVSPRSLEGWRVRGGGPAYIKIGNGLIRYEETAVLGWIAAQRRRSTSDTTGRVAA